LFLLHVVVCLRTGHQFRYLVTDLGHPRGENLMKTGLAVVLALVSTAALGADVVRHPLGGGSTFPIARAVSVPANYETIWHSGITPAPADPKATPGTPAYWGDTKAQALSVFARIKESLDTLGLGFGDVVKMTVFLAGDPATGGRMNFDGFMEAYGQYFGTKEQPKLPARSTVQVASLVQPGMLVEIEVVLVKPAR
jgi:enamine deaminase RidA (YjgF/YER057c/UK114 family)